MAKPKKDGQHVTYYFDRTTLKRLKYYAALKGQTDTMALERIVKSALDAENIPQNPDMETLRV